MMIIIKGAALWCNVTKESLSLSSYRQGNDNFGVNS